MTTTIKVVTGTGNECSFENIGTHPKVMELLEAGFTPIGVNTTPGFERWFITFVGDSSKLKEKPVSAAGPVLSPEEVSVEEPDTISTDKTTAAEEAALSPEEVPVEEPEVVEKPKRTTRKTTKKTGD